VRFRRTASTLSILVALAVGHLITSRLDVGTREAAPFFTSGSVGKAVHLSYADIEVTDVQPAKYLSPQISTELARLAAGVFVMVAVTLTATREPTIFAAAYLVDDEGRQLRSSNRSECAFSAKGQTGLPEYAVFCFDVPPDRLAGLHLQIGRGSLTFSTLQSDAVADIDLGVDSTDEKAWADTEDAYGSQSTSDEPIELQKVTLTQQDPS
jgi:hypothetical protein